MDTRKQGNLAHLPTGVFMDKIVLSSVNTVILPQYISLNVIGPQFMALMGTLGKMEKEGVAYDFVDASRKHGQWVGFTYADRVGANTLYAQMVKEGLIVETKTDDGWTYELSHSAIETIYLAQSQYIIRQLSKSLELKNKTGFWQYVWGLMTKPRVLA